MSKQQTPTPNSVPKALRRLALTEKRLAANRANAQLSVCCRIGTAVLREYIGAVGFVPEAARDRAMRRRRHMSNNTNYKLELNDGA